MMAVKAPASKNKAYKQPVPVAAPRTADTGWSFADGDTIPQGGEQRIKMPEGGDRKFPGPSLRGKTFIDVTQDNPEHFFSMHNAKTLHESLSHYVVWVKHNYDIDYKKKTLTQHHCQPTH